MNTNVMDVVATATPVTPLDGGAAARRRPAPPMARLNAVAGFDLALALHYVGGEPSTLLRVLRRFVATYRHGVPAMLDTTGAEHEVILRWRTACHSVRGALAMVGASQLSEEASGLDRALRDLASRAHLGAMGRQLHEGVANLAGRLAVSLED